MTQQLDLFNPNSDNSTFVLPSPLGNGPVYSPEQYVAQFDALAKNSGTTIDELVKSLNTPPSSLAMSRISYMPETYNKGVLQWPGIAPEALGKIVKENLAPQLIIGMRVDDVMRYSQVSEQPWRPGWTIELRGSHRHATRYERQEISDAKEFLCSANIQYGGDEARERDSLRIDSFTTFLAKLVRDSLTYDGMAVWTDMDIRGRVKAFSALPSGNIRLAGPAGYEANKDLFAVMVDEGGAVQHSFTRDELTFYVRNPRTNQTIGGYGYSEIEIAVRLIQGFQNALDLNVNTFNRNSIPNGILVMSGDMVTSKQLDILNRVWTNLKQGITKAWSLPVIGLNGNGKLELIDLSDVKGKEAYYEDFMNMVAGAFATIYRFPVRRLGYRISGGHGKDTEPWPDASEQVVDDSDPGLAPLLIHIENLINQYLLWTRWPHLQFRFSGKNPKEDAREYQSRQDAMTWGEKRAATGLIALEDTVGGDEDLKMIAKIMSMSPTDPNLSGVFQSVVAAFTKAAFGGDKKDPETPGPRMLHQRDPAASEAHGAIGGVRRNSAAESH